MGEYQVSPEMIQAISASVAEEAVPWPEPMDDAAFYGLAGEIVANILRYTEAGQEALLADTLINFGNMIGRTAFAKIGNAKHYCNEFACLVGPTGSGRKGTSRADLKPIFDAVDDLWSRERVQGGLSSGEGLIWAVRDPLYRVKKPQKGEPVSYDNPELELEDPGVSDKRILCIESEFGQTLQSLKREGNTLSPVLRLAWDGSECIQSLVKTAKGKATGAHISLMAHITKEELSRQFAEVEKSNGLSNRILWFCVRRSKYLPLGEATPEETVNELSVKLDAAVVFAKKQGEITMDDIVKEEWCKIYPDLADACNGGLDGTAMARGTAHVRRLMMMYALMDFSNVVKIDHLKAAIAVWDYVKSSAAYIFGNSGAADDLSKNILECLQKGPKSQSEIYRFLNCNVPAKKIRTALERLSMQGKISCEITKPDQGRAKTIWMLAT